MMHITEDTPPDMLAGAMDLTVHLPSGRAVKMSVERSTPMMDLLVQITTSHNLQLSGHILHALGMAPSAGIGDKVLPYKPNTPIGALDTQHIKVVPKNKTQTAPKNVPPGHQPFESTFRLKVHLPRNQLYVTRVSRNVYLEEIMNKVCVEKDLDPLKYELRHPGNLAVLDPKLTLSDYQITEIFVVVKGAGGLAQGLSTSDIMALRKIEEERKQFQAKTGGGVFNLIFRRGKTTAPNGSVSSNENRSISPSDDSRSVTPPGVPPPIIKETPQEKPKPPQRKRRPAPKPPQPQNEVRNVAEKPASQISNTSNQSDTSSKKGDNGLLICHSRNSSDSSGYHEASILSDNCNTSLPRRPRTMYEDTTDARMVNGEHSRSIGNLAKMSSQSKSTTSLLAPGRKKKAAPPPPGRRIEESVEKTSPVVASHPVEANTEATSLGRSLSTNPPVPAPRRLRTPSRASSVIINDSPSITDTFKNDLSEKLMKRLPMRPRTIENTTISRESSLEEGRIEDNTEEDVDNSPNDTHAMKISKRESLTMDKLETKEDIIEEEEVPENIVEDRPERLVKTNNDDSKPTKEDQPESLVEDTSNITSLSEASNKLVAINQPIDGATLDESNDYQKADDLDNTSLEMQLDDQDTQSIDTDAKSIDYHSGDSIRKSISMDSLHSDFSATSVNSKGSKPEIVGVIPKKRKATNFDTLTRKRGFQIGTSLLNIENEDDMLSLTTTSDGDCLSEYPSLSSVDQSNDFDLDINEEIFQTSLSKKTGKKFRERKHELLGMHTLDEALTMNQHRSNSSLRSVDSLPGFMGNGTIKKWNNVQDLDDISNVSVGSLRARNRTWMVGDVSDTESISTIPTTSNTPPESPSVHPQSAATSSTNSTRNSISNLMLPTPTKEDVTKIETKSPISIKEETPQIKKTDEDDSGICENTLSDSTEKDELEVENDWQYQLPSPPKGFRDVSPSVRTESSNYEIETIPDSVVTSPELFEKLKHVQDVQSVASDLPSVVSEVEEKEMCNKLTLENLEKRKTLVYNRELATSLKYAQEDTSERKKVINELEDVITNNKTSSILRPNKPISINRSSTLPDNRNLPNFKITTYDGKKEKVNIFEDDTIRSNEKATLKNTTSMENLSFFKKDYPKQEEETFKKPVAVKQPTLPSVSLSINRSESFSVNSHWSPANPVKRSKSQIALNRNKDGDRKSTDGTTLSKSNSLLDVSGLQSVEVMRMIQTKLNSSRDSLDNVAEEQPKPEIKAPQQPEPKPVPQPKPTTPTNYSSRSFQPPSINLCAWSQRPKCEVTLKEDTDYKLGTGTLKTKVNLKSTPSFNGYKPPQTSEVTHKQNGVNIKINGAEPIVQQKSGNVVIKIGGDQKEPERTTNHFQNDVFRKPLGNVNNVERSRPHSIAFDCQGSYAPPIVRAVELKKEFQDLPVAKSITQISGHVESQPKSLNYTNSFSISDKNSSVYLSNEALNKPVFRTKSFNPVVKGFNNNNRATWNAYGTLPGKNQPEDLNTNKNVPFSQSNLRRTDSNKVLNNNTSSNIFGNVVLRNNTNSFKTKETTKPVEKSQQSPPPPPAPPMAKLVTKPAKIIQPTTSIDSKDLLLEEIRSFGGKKGLKART